jgi:phosphoribosylanthranilate isomerase
MMQVKICGLRRVEDALVAAAAGATMLGFVFAPSRRRIEQEEAREIIDRVRRMSSDESIAMIGVFVNASADEINRVARVCGLDFAQLSGEEPNVLVDALELPSIQVFHVQPDESSDGLRERVAATSAPLVMLDTARPGVYGGTGESFSWDLIPDLESPVLLAGGLTTDNVAEAIRVAKPWGVDVSSGVETNGEKDQLKIRQFIAAARGVGVEVGP